MAATTGLQGRIIGAGLLAAIGLLIYGTIVNETIVGVDATVATTWVFAATFAVLAVVHASVGRYDLTLGHGVPPSAGCSFFCRDDGDTGRPWTGVTRSIRVLHRDQNGSTRSGRGRHRDGCDAGFRIVDGE